MVRLAEPIPKMRCDCPALDDVTLDVLKVLAYNRKN